MDRWDRGRHRGHREDFKSSVLDMIHWSGGLFGSVASLQPLLEILESLRRSPETMEHTDWACHIMYDPCAKTTATIQRHINPNEAKAKTFNFSMALLEALRSAI